MEIKINYKDYIIVNHMEVPYIELIDEYWQDVVSSGHILNRLSDVSSPEITDVYDMLRESGDNIYYIWSLSSRMIIGEYMLDNSYARTVQLHFSIHSGLGILDKFRLGIYTTDKLLEVYSSLYGVIPLKNSRANKFIHGIGFEPKLILKGGCYYNCEVSDALVSVKDVPINRYK